MIHPVSRDPGALAFRVDGAPMRVTVPTGRLRQLFRYRSQTHIGAVLLSDAGCNRTPHAWPRTRCTRPAAQKAEQLRGVLHRHVEAARE
jgi:hypothetical protein